MLEYFATTYLDHPAYPLARGIKAIARAAWPRMVPHLERRASPGIPRELLRTKPVWELLRTFSSNVLRNPVLTDAVWERGEHAFDRWVADGLDAPDAVYTYEHASLATLRAAKARGVYTFYEQPSQHHAFFSRLQREQEVRHPGIANAATALTSDSKAGPRNRRRDAELAEADCVMCNSSFTRRTLVEAGVHPTRIEVIPYGFPPPSPRSAPQEGPVVFMNAGTQNLRKGLHLLYLAWRELDFDPGHAELWLIGKMLLPEALRRGLPGRVRIFDSVPHTELLNLYRRASVFVLPSLADGFGMVVTEAMSRGLAVITTEHTGASDVIRPGETGMVVQAGSVDALREQMRWCVANPARLSEMGGRAAAAAASWQWSDYRRAVASTALRRIEESRFA